MDQDVATTSRSVQNLPAAGPRHRRSPRRQFLPVQRIGLLPRLAAFLLELVLAAAVAAGLIALEVLPSLPISETLGLGNDSALDDGPAFLLGLLGISLVEAVLGCGPGKLLLGLQVGYDDGGRGNPALYLGRWTIKNTGPLLAVLALILGSAWLIVAAEGALLVILVGGGIALLGREHQALHDRAVHSAVYRAEDLRAG